MTAEERLEAIVRGDSVAFADWLREAEQPLRRSLLRFAAQVDVEAVLQETLLRVWELAPRFQPDGRPDGLLRFAHTIARNLAISEARRRGRELELGEEPAPTPRAPDPGLRDTLARCHGKLPRKPRAALDARLEAQGGERDSVTAERLGMTKNTFLQNLTRARRLLGKCLEKNGVRLAELL